MRRIANDVKGEVLLALSIDNLKSEFGIESFGARFDIVKAVDELRSEGECKWSSRTLLTFSFPPCLPLASSSLPFHQPNAYSLLVTVRVYRFLRHLTCICSLSRHRRYLATILIRARRLPGILIVTVIESRVKTSATGFTIG
jgi:hypothetical protein